MTPFSKAIYLALIGTVASASVAASASAATPSASVPASSLSWVMDWSTAHNIASNPAAVADLQGATIYEIVRIGGTVAPGLNALATLDFKSVSTMATAFAAGDIKPWDRAVVYDPEHWSLTPLSEQLAVVSATAEAVQLAAEYHLTLIATPATDLMEVLTPHQWPLYKDYLNYDLAGKCAAPGVAIFDIQAQALETKLTPYLAQTSGAAAQVTAADASTLSLGDVTDHLGGAAVPTSKVVAAILASEPYVKGYYLNAPTEGAAIIKDLG